MISANEVISTLVEDVGLDLGATLVKCVMQQADGAPFRELLAFATDLAGARARFLPRGEFVGALGTLSSRS
ncbi:MAG: hypothetical protein ABIT01_08315 [Thermoanaerobaculia bacterium]